MSDSNQLATSASIMQTSLMANTKTTPMVSDFESTPYVIFFGPKQKSTPAVIEQLKSVPEGTPLLFWPDGTIERLDNMQFLLTPMYLHHYSVADQDTGAILKSVLPPTRKPTKSYVETIDSIIFVLAASGFTPARCSFKSTKCPAAKDVEAEVIASGTDEWAKISTDHAAAAQQVQQQWARVVGTVTLTPNRGKIPDENGKLWPYVQADATTKPISGGQYVDLLRATQDVDIAKTFADCLKQHNKRVAEVVSKCS